MKNLQLLPRADDRYRTQEQAIEFHNGRKEVMASVPDTLQLGQDPASRESFHKDFDEFLVSSTSYHFSATDLSGSIIHNKGSKFTKETEFKLKEIPVCRPTYLDKLLETEVGLKFIRALSNMPKATKKQIGERFMQLSGKEPSRIRIWTPTQEMRADRQVRSVGLFFIVGVFGVVGGWFNGDYVGFSRGVKSSSKSASAKQTQFESRGAVFDTEKGHIIMNIPKKLLRQIERKNSLNKKVKITWKFSAGVR